MLNPQWLRSFVVLADVGSFTRTADQLGLTQAAVSQHVRHLEAQLGTLVIRQPRRMDLTPAGHALLAYCDEMEQADMRLRLRMSEGDKTRGQFSLITPGSCGLLLYPLLLDLQEQHPDLVVRHRFAPDTEISDAVLGKRYEIGLVTAKPDDPHLTSSHFAEEPLELIVPAGQKVKLTFVNFDDTPEEIDSFSLNREKVIFAKSRGTIFIGPLKAGEYPFFGEFHPNSAVGKVVVKSKEDTLDAN